MNNLFQKTNNDKITQFALAHKSLILKATALVSALFILIAISCCVGSSRAKKRLATMEKEMEAEAIAKEKAKFQMTEYDDVTVRKVIECIRVLSKTEVQIIFKGGFEMNITVDT